MLTISIKYDILYLVSSCVGQLQAVQQNTDVLSHYKYTPHILIMGFYIIKYNGKIV